MTQRLIIDAYCYVDERMPLMPLMPLMGVVRGAYMYNGTVHTKSTAVRFTLASRSLLGNKGWTRLVGARLVCITSKASALSRQPLPAPKPRARSRKQRTQAATLSTPRARALFSVGAGPAATPSHTVATRVHVGSLAKFEELAGVVRAESIEASRLVYRQVALVVPEHR